MTPQERATVMRDENQQIANVPADLAGVVPRVPRARDYPDAVVWLPTDDGSKVISYRPGEALDPAEPIELHVGRLVLWSMTREEARRLADALNQANDVAGGAP